MLAARINQMKKDATALDMSKETIAQTPTEVGALDETGNIGEDELAAVNSYDPEERVERRERIIGDLGFCRRYARQEGRFSGVRKANNASIGHQLEAQPKCQCLPRLTWVCSPRRSVRRTLEMGIAKSAIAAARDNNPRTDLGKIGDELFPVFIIYLRSNRYHEHSVGALAARAISAHSVHPGLTFKMLLIAVIDQCVQSIDALDDHVPAPSAVAAIGSTKLNELFPPEGNATGSAIAGTNADFYLIEKFHGGHQTASFGTDDRPKDSARTAV
jgi:hypothetical protein